MGKLIERLNKSGKSTAAPIGFGRTAPAAEPALGIVAALGSSDKGLAKKAVEQGALAVVLGSSDKGAAKDSGLEVPVGASLPANCAAWDFVVAGPDDALDACIEANSIDVVLRLPEKPSDHLVRTLEALPVDAFIMAPPKSLTAEGLAQVYRVTRSTQKHVLAATPADVSKVLLTALRDAGVAGVLVNVSKDNIEGLGALKKTIAALPPKKSRSRTSRGVATLPSVSVPEPVPQRDDDDDDDDD